MNYSVSSDKWSIYQVLSHIVLCEEAITQKTISNLEKKKSANIGWKSKLNLFIFQLSLLVNIKYKTPETVNPTLVEEMDFDSLISRWEQSRVQLELIGGYSDTILARGIFKHPSLGFISYKQIMSFFEMHYQHHLKQINQMVELNLSSEEYSLSV